jgi:hypothetical protein
MGEDAKIGVAREFVGNLFHVGIHFRTDAFTGGEKIFRHIYFPCHVFLRDELSILVDKREAMYIAEHRQLCFSVAGDEPGQCKIEPEEQQDEEAYKKTQFFLIHD